MITGSLKSILIPVDFSINTETALEKIIKLIEPFDSMIHLLHVMKPPTQLNRYQRKRFFMQADEEQKNAETAKMQLYELKQRLWKLLPSANISTELVTGGSIQNKIIEKANQLSAELIVVIKNTNRKLLSFATPVNATLIAKETNSAVMVINRSAIPSKIRSIVLPVCSFVPERDIDLLSALTRKHKPVVRLVIISDEDSPCNKTSIFINTYRTLSDILHYPVEYRVLSKNNFLKIVFGYGKNVMADLIFINPFEEANTKTSYKTDISDMISPDSRFCVLISKTIS